MRVEQPFPRLPRDLIGEVRQAMLRPGFALVQAPLLFNDRQLRRLKDSTSLVSDYRNGWRRCPSLTRYGSWLERLLGEALPEEAVRLAALEFRHEPAGTEDEEVDRLHVDGSYIRAVYTVSGRATIYRHRGVELPVPPGQILLLTAIDRARAVRISATLHRRPGGGAERVVIVCSFESRPGDAGA